MNVLGSFTFGSLVKTFLPGFIWLGFLLLCYRDLVALLPGVPALASIVPSAADEQIAAAAVVSILLGLLSNIVVFMGLNDRLVRGPVRARETVLFALYEGLKSELRDLYWQRAACTNAGLHSTFMAECDPELLMLPTIGVEVLSYVREQYWYHLEFQANLLPAVTLLLGALVIRTFEHHLPLAAATMLVVLECLLLGSLCRLLLVAARRNYARHIAKMSSLMAAVLCAERNPPAAAGVHGQ